MEKWAKGHANGCNLGNATLRKQRFRIRHLCLSSPGGNLPRLVCLMMDKVLKLGTLAQGFLVSRRKRQQLGVRGSQKDSELKVYVS